MTGIYATIEAGKFRSILEAMMEADVSVEDRDQSALLVWHDSLKESDFFGPLKAWQVVNRIPSINILCRKAPYARVINRMQPYFPNLYSFMPKTYILPIQQKEFAAALKSSDKSYVYKPDGGSKGHGIIILEGRTEYTGSESQKLAVAQQYIDSFLIDETKFDLRLYITLL